MSPLTAQMLIEEAITILKDVDLAKPGTGQRRADEWAAVLRGVDSDFAAGKGPARVMLCPLPDGSTIRVNIPGDESDRPKERSVCKCGGEIVSVEAPPIRYTRNDITGERTSMPEGLPTAVCEHGHRMPWDGKNF